MNLTKINLKYTDTDSADTEIKYAVVSSGFKGAELVLLGMPNETPAVQKRIFAQAKRILKEFRERGKITFLATPDNFTKNDTVCQYVYDMYPVLREQLPEIKGGYEFLLFKH